MRAERRDLLERLFAAGRAFDAAEPDRTRRRRNVEPDSGAFLHLLVGSLAPASLLELGTSNGYSTIWLADALPPGARLLTVDVDAGRAAQARANLAEAGLAGVVEQRLDDAGRVLAASADAAWPVVFLDAERADYVSYWPDLRRVLAPGGLLVVDNCVSHAAQVASFRALVDAEPGFESVLVPVGAGLLLVRRERRPLPRSRVVPRVAGSGPTHTELNAPEAATAAVEEDT